MSAQDLRRLGAALACAIAVHEVAAMLIPRPSAVVSQDAPIIARVTITRAVHTPRPTPRPTPPAPIHTIAPSIVPAGKHAHVEPIKRVGAKRPTPPKSLLATPDVAVLPTGGQGAGAQNGTGAGSTSSVNGSGSGTGNAGSGNGAAICGAVDFESSGNAKYDPQTGYYERNNIIATVYYADGTSQRIPLDWTWRYKNEADDPLRPGSSAPMLFQFPPPQQLATEPPAIQYIVAHTTPTGRTRLVDQCPNIPPPPTPQP